MTDPTYEEEARSILQRALNERLPATAEGFGEETEALNRVEAIAVTAVAALLSLADTQHVGLIHDGSFDQ